MMLYCALISARINLGGPVNPGKEKYAFSYTGRNGRNGVSFTYGYRGGIRVSQEVDYCYLGDGGFSLIARSCRLCIITDYR